MKRRGFLLGAGVLGLAAVGIVELSEDKPLALVYRGPASTDGCPEAVAALLEPHYDVEYTGPDEKYPLTATSLAKAAVYAQPGGGGLDDAWHTMRGHAGDIRTFVRGGGSYLGFCLGGYLAGASPGFDLLPGDTDQYVGSAGAHLHSTRDLVLGVTWRGVPRQVYFQDGPVFLLHPGAPATVLATYPTGAVAAVVTGYGKGKVGVVGPHPEADQSWFHDAKLDSAGAVHPELAQDLIATTTAR